MIFKVYVLSFALSILRWEWGIWGRKKLVCFQLDKDGVHFEI